MTKPKIEIRPKVSRNVTLMVIGCVIFTVTGFWMVLFGEEVFVGVLCILFFGGGGIYAIPKMLRRKVSMTLAPGGIELHYEQGNASIPWLDIERVGVISIFSNRMVGIRLKSYDRYLDGMSPALAEFITKNLPYLKLIARAATFADVPTSVAMWSKLEGHNVSEALDSFGKVGDLSRALLWSRKQYGYDLVLSWAEIDRSATDFAILLNDYLSAAKHGQSS